jgi:multidrug efflux pump subunit AcrA (membrane-fusion protein)
MLNISFEKVSGRIDVSKYGAFKILEKKSISGVIIKIIIGLIVLLILSMFLPWTQNIRAKGYVTTLNPYDRPQTIQSMIGGKIEKWYVQEGQFVNAGDTIIMISEVKEEYLDPEILDRTNSQILAKTGSASAYDVKAINLSSQIDALIQMKKIKLEQNTIKLRQTSLKLLSDSMDMVAAKVQLNIAINQLSRQEELFKKGLKSLTDLEEKRLSLQESQAKVATLVNKVDAQRNELLNLQSNIIAIESEYDDKIAKAQSERMSAISDKYNAKANINKLQSDFNAYSVRQDNYFIKSPITGYITKAIKYGIGEIIKNGDEIVSIMPEKYELGIEMYVPPRDVPLLNKDQKVMVQFDGWPAIVFSGWPNNSFGTFTGRVFAIDNFISDNGKYRILVAPDKNETPWPEQVRVGGGANAIALLKNVRIGYELWRQLNGFPQDYYNPDEFNKMDKSKIPLKKVK